MKAVTSVFVSVLAKQFYRLNAGFFLLVIGVCFGFLKGSEHIALAQYFVSSTLLVLIPVSVWLLYSIKVIFFNDSALKNNNNQFLSIASTLPGISLLLLSVRVGIQQLAPVALYGAFLCGVAIQIREYSAVPVIVTVFLLLTLSTALRLRWSLLHFAQEKITGSLQRGLSTRFTRPYSTFFPEWILRGQPMMVLGIKVVASILLAGICYLYQIDNYDERLFDLGCTLVFLFNLMLVFHYHRFENFHFNMLRSLPIPLMKRFGYTLVIFGILQIVEIATLFNYRPASVSLLHAFIALIFGWSIQVLAYSFLFTRDRTLESFVNILFFMGMLWMLLILFGVPLLLLTAIQLVGAYWIYASNFYRFEFDAAVASEK